MNPAADRDALSQLTTVFHFERQEDGRIQYELSGSRWVGTPDAAVGCSSVSGIVDDFDELQTLLVNGDEGLLRAYMEPLIWRTYVETVHHREGPPPGERFARVLRFVFPRKRYEDIVDPILADAEGEWVAAVVSNDRSGARRVRVQCNLQLLYATGLSLPVVRLLAWLLDWIRYP
ncbi:MAG: hypothetical protein AAF430_01335 [Myxococcota bacterium]